MRYLWHFQNATSGPSACRVVFLAGTTPAPSWYSRAVEDTVSASTAITVCIFIDPRSYASRETNIFELRVVVWDLKKHTSASTTTTPATPVTMPTNGIPRSCALFASPAGDNDGGEDDDGDEGDDVLWGSSTLSRVTSLSCKLSFKAAVLSTDPCARISSA